MTDAEIAGIMGWRGPGAYTEAAMRKVRQCIAAETARCAAVVRSVNIEVIGDDGSKQLWDMERLAQMIEGTEPIPPAYQADAA